MAVSKVILNGTVLIDTTDKTVTDSSMLNGITALDSAGVSITGNIATKSSSNMTVSGATVTAPAGYYATDASKTVASGSATTPTTTITANPSISVSNSGLITATASASQSITPTISSGYVTSGTSGTITVSGSNTSQLTVYAGANHSSGYSITVSLINPSSPEAFESCEIYQINSNHLDEFNFYDDLTKIGEVSSPTGSTVALMSESAIGLAIGCSGSGMSVAIGDSDVTTTGGVTFKPWSQASQPPWPYVGMTDIYFEASGSGTITLSSIEWDDD